MRARKKGVVAASRAGKGSNKLPLGTRTELRGRRGEKATERTQRKLWRLPKYALRSTNAHKGVGRRRRHGNKKEDNYRLIVLLSSQNACNKFSRDVADLSPLLSPSNNGA